MSYGHDSLKLNIKLLAKREFPNWLNGGRFERLAFDLGYKASNASRRCRELVREGYLERRENEKGNVEYRWLPEKDQPSDMDFVPYELRHAVLAGA